MTACVNKRRALAAALAGVLALGGAAVALPAVALAEGASAQFVQPGAAYTAGKVVSATFSQSGTTFDYSSTTAAKINYAKNKAVVLDYAEVKMTSVSEEATTFKFNAAGKTDNGQYEVKYYAADADGKPTGDAITKDVTAAGKYVAVITATSGNYADGYACIPFEIAKATFNAATVEFGTTGNQIVNYCGDAQKVVVKDSTGTLIEGTEYTIEYFVAGHDLTDAYKVSEIVNAGSYNVRITATDANYSGKVEFKSSDGALTVKALDLSTVAKFEAIVSTDAVNEPHAPEAVWIDGVRHGSDSAVVSQLVAEMVGSGSYGSTDGNEFYDYTVSPKTEDDPNFANEGTVTVSKVTEALTWTYDGDAWTEAVEHFVKTAKPDTWNSGKVAASAKGDTAPSYTGIKTSGKGVYKSGIGDETNAASGWGSTAGTYTLVYYAKDAEGHIVGKAVAVLTNWNDALDADASATVNYDQDGVSGTVYDYKVVSSISKTYDGTDLLADKKIVVSVKDPKGGWLTEGTDFVVTYYNAAGGRVKEIVNAGTYTLKLTSSSYKLSGTTEMTITVGKYDLSNVKSGAVVTEKYDDTNTTFDYLPYSANGYTIAGLNLLYKAADQKVAITCGPTNATYELTTDAIGLAGKTYYYHADNKSGAYLPYTAAGQTIVDGVNPYGYYLYEQTSAGSSATTTEIVTVGGWQSLPMDVVKVTITKDGSEVKKITDEGVYVLKFEARNDDAANNYVIPSDITVTCVKSGHLKFADVKYTDYFADAADFVSGKGFMVGYQGTRLFGSYDKLTRGQMCIVLYNMASAANKTDETDLVYDKFYGYASFDDVDGTMYYGKAIAWAKQAGIVTGYGDTGNFGPEDLVTREQFALMLSRYAAKFGGKTISGADADFSVFTDSASVSSWAKEAVAWCVSEGIMGVHTTALNPQSSILRAEAACMVYRYAK